MLLLQNDILEMVARGEPLAVTARALCLGVEAILPDVICSIITVDPAGRMHPLASPSLPAAYSVVFEGLPIGPRVGSCGTAIHSGEGVQVQDIANDPLWALYADHALAFGLKACWSTPVFGRDGAVLGAFAFYYREPRAPTRRAANVVRASLHLAAIAIERERQAREEHRLAYRDLLTDLPNRAAFDKATLDQGRRGAALLLIDLDNLKTLNDTFGHRAGDCLLKAAAERLATSVAPHYAYRFGGDEFAVLVDRRAASPDGLNALANRILAALAEPADCDGHLVAPRATIGGAIPRKGEDVIQVRRNADFALYHAKETRRGGYVAYSSSLGTTMTRRLAAVRDVGQALSEGRVDVHYQPVVRMDTGEIIGLEALFRLITPSGEARAAGDFFEATADPHTAVRLTRCVLGIVARDVRAWLDQGIWFQHVGINASAADFQGGRLHEAIREAFDREDVPLSHVVLEVTETVYLGHQGGEVAKAVQALRDEGLRVALDDFGTGYASLTHLLSVPVDIIKIDKSFVARMEPGSRSEVIIEGVLGIASRLGIRVIGEGVETTAQAERLRDMGCTLGQGYLFSRPVDRRVVTRLLLDRVQRRDPDLPGVASPIDDVAITIPERLEPARGEGPVVRYAILLCGEHWRVVSERRQFGRFPSRSAAFQCALRLAREANSAGASVELLHADAGAQLHRFDLDEARA